MLGSRIISKFYLEIKILIWWIIEIKNTVDRVSDVMQKEAGIFSGHHSKFCPMSDMDRSNRIKIRMNIWNYKPSCNLNWHASMYIVHITEKGLET